MADMKNVIEQRISNNEKSICEKCSHRRVCRAIDNQPCFECNQFEQEVVRCKDCKNDGQCSVQDAMKWTPRTEITDCFCSYGEGRVGE